MENQGTITLSQRELNRVAVIAGCVKGTTSVRRAAALLQLSPRQIKRLKWKFRSGGAAAMAHAGRGRASPRRLPAPLRQRILHLARTTYAGFNDHHLTEKLHEAEAIRIGREALRQLLRAAGIGPPRKRRPPAHRQRRPRRLREGEMLQVDASPHDWLEGRGPQLTLLGFQDDATSKVVGAEFFPAETAHGYFRVFRRVLRRYGVPLSLYGDRSGVFVRNDNHWTVEEELAGRQQPTQFGRALEQLGVTFIAALSPQAKGRIERLWGVFQDRLRSELRLAGATDLETANQVLRRFLPDYNRRFGRAPANAEKAWRAAPRELDRICCLVHERIVSNDNVVRWEGRRFQIPPQPRRFSFAGARVQLVEDLAGRVAVYHGATKLQVESLSGERG
jgi:transposase